MHSAAAVTLLVLVEVIDGQLLQSEPVVTSTRPLRMCIGVQVLELPFYVAAVPYFPLVLWLEWLQDHDFWPFCDPKWCGSPAQSVLLIP